MCIAIQGCKEVYRGVHRNTGVTVQLDVVSNDCSTNGVALFVEKGSIHALETVTGKQLQNNI